MTWKELRDKTGGIPAEEQEKHVTFWAEEQPPKDVTLSRCIEDVYGNDSWGFSAFKSDCQKDDLEDPRNISDCRKKPLLFGY